MPYVAWKRMCVVKGCRQKDLGSLETNNLVSPSPSLWRHNSLTGKLNIKLEIKGGKVDERKHSCRSATVLPGEGSNFTGGLYK